MSAEPALPVALVGFPGVLLVGVNLHPPGDITLFPLFRDE